MKAVFYTLTVLTVCLWGLALRIWLLSRAPERGANMVLMAIPLIGAAAILTSLGAVFAGRRVASKCTLFRACYAVNVATLAIALPAAALG